MKKSGATYQGPAKFVFVFIALLTMNISCFQKKAVCKGNCRTIEVNGKVINAMTNEPAPNVSMVMEWHRSIGWFNEETVIRLKSKADGTFSGSVAIDSSRFGDEYHLVLFLNESNKWITDIGEYAASMSENAEAPNFSNILFTVYPSVPLTIKLNRKDTSDFGMLHVSCWFNDRHKNWPVENGEPGKVGSEVTVYTCPDVYTKIEVSKTKNFNDITFMDSIKCSRDKKNVYTVNY